MSRKRIYMPQTRIDHYEDKIAMRLFGKGIDSAKDIFSFLQFNQENEKRILSGFMSTFWRITEEHIKDFTINGKIDSRYQVAPYAGHFGVKYCVHDTDTGIFHTAKLSNNNLEITGIMRLM